MLGACNSGERTIQDTGEAKSEIAQLRLNKLNMKAAALDHARLELIGADLEAWQQPIYQVLGLDHGPAPRKPSKGAMRLGDILN